MRTKLNSVMMLPVVIMTVMMLVPQVVGARELGPWNFSELANACGNTNLYDNSAVVPLSNTRYNSITNGYYGTVTTYGTVSYDLSRFAFRSAYDRGWYFYNGSDGSGLIYGNGTPEFAITDLRPNDIVKITFRGRGSRTVSLAFKSGSANQGNNVLSNGSIMSTSSNGAETVAQFTVKDKCDVVFYTTGGKYETVIASISIERPDVASYDYSPTNYEVYDIYYSTSGTTFQTANAGFTLNTRDAVYLKNLSSGLALNNRVAVSQSSQGTSQWVIDRGIKAQWSWHNVSICNLEAGDRVRIYFTGEAVFSSVRNSATYNGCPAFLDYYNDGIKNNGQFETTDDGDRNITGGTPVAVAASGWNGLLDQNLKTSEVYVIEADGHLDIGLNGTADNEKGSRIVKIEIYSDHPAMMVDKYNGSSTTGYTSYFDVTGQLQGKEHIMPGGLEIHVGNESTEQYAIVTQTDEGPASFVYDQERYKMARIERGQFNVSTAFPGYGTYYKFIPQVSGTMSLKFKAFSINYRDYSKNGDVAIDQYGTPNEEARPNVSCPYYLMEQTSGSTTPSQKMTATYGHGATSDATFTNITVEAGKTYWLYGWWSNGSASNNFSDGSHAAGVAELVEVTFVPNNMVYPLAKWVANGTTSDDYLASVSGTTVTVKKKSANILSCTPIIEGGMLKISGITYAQGADQGGTILLKVGDPNNDDDPVFALTIAYDASKGHTWNFSENPLRGLDWSNWDNNSKPEAEVKNFGRADDTNSLLYQEMNEANGHSDWTFNYRVKKGDQLLDPRYLNKYDMVGDNADMMWDTEGLIINTASNQSCIYEDIEGTVAHTSGQSDPDRYVGILPGGEFIIPQLKADDRVIIYMGSGSGSGSQTMHFNITNALDAVHNEIIATDDYYAGGSQWNVDGNNHNDPYYRGCYHFFAKANGDMKFKLVGGSMCKLYSIQIYHGERINTNGVQEGTKGSGYTLLATKDGGTGETKTWNLHYRGKGETLADGIERNGKTIKNEFIACSGTITKENTPLTTNSNTISCTNNGVIGMARVRAKCMEYNQRYVTDFADRNLTFAYHEKVPEYPYTWDFTDINGFSSSAITGEYNNYNELQSGDDGYEFEPKGRELSMWDKNSAMVIYCTDGDYYTNQNMIFENAKGINGNQLYANGGAIPETKGLWFYFDNNDAAYNGSMRIAADGLHLANKKVMKEDGTTNLTMGWWNYKMVVPDVPINAAVYLRMERDQSVGDGDYSQKPDEDPVYFLNTSYHFGISDKDHPKTSLTPVTSSSYNLSNQADIINADGNSSSKYSFYKVPGKTGEWIAIVKNTTGKVDNLTFTLNGWILKKMSVATDEKTVNKFGWNTESRDHAIDPSLLPYMTGKDFRTYIVTGVSAENKTATLARIDGGSGDDLENTRGKLYVPGAVEDPTANPVVPKNGSINACIVRYVDPDKDEDDQQFGVFERTVEKNGKTEIEKFFHLFVPDMHDDATARNTLLEGNKLKARVTPTQEASGDTPRDKVERYETVDGKTYNNYAFTFKYVKVNGAGNATSDDQKDGVQAFYRIVSGGAKSNGNQAYLSIPEVIASSRAAVRAEEAEATPESYTLVFKDWYELEGEKGDVNGDGLVNEADMELTKDYVTERYSQGLFKRMGDMNDDGKVDIVDLTLLIQKIMGE